MTSTPLTALLPPGWDCVAVYWLLAVLQSASLPPPTLEWAACALGCLLLELGHMVLVEDRRLRLGHTILGKKYEEGCHKMTDNINWAKLIWILLFEGLLQFGNSSENCLNIKSCKTLFFHIYILVDKYYIWSFFSEHGSETAIFYTGFFLLKCVLSPNWTVPDLGLRYISDRKYIADIVTDSWTLIQYEMSYQYRNSHCGDL